MGREDSSNKNIDKYFIALAPREKRLYIQYFIEVIIPWVEYAGKGILYSGLAGGKQGSPHKKIGSAPEHSHKKTICVLLTLQQAF
jgi:hypothetical protein